MRKTVKFIGTWLLAITLLISCMSPVCVEAVSNTKVAKTQKQLEKLLSDENTKTIQINTTKKITITIPKGDFDKKIVINAPKASVVNKGRFNGITVTNLTKYTEKTKGNTLTVKDSKLTLAVPKSAEVKSVTVSNKKADVKIVADGSVKKVTVNAAKSVDIQGDHKKPINVNSNAKGATIKANSAVNVTMNKDGNLVINVEQVKVVAGKDNVETKITNNTEITIVIVDKNNETVGEVKSDETSKVTNEKDDKNKTDKEDNDDKDKDKENGNKDVEDKDKNDNKDNDKKDDSSNQNTDNSSSSSSSGGSSGGSSSGSGSPIVTNNYSITVTSSPAILYTNSVGTVNYELKNNSTKLSAVPTSYKINTVTSGCAVTAVSFGSITVSASAISGNATLRIELLDGNNNVVTSKTVAFSIGTPTPSTPPFSLSELNNGYQIKFTYWDDSNNFFNTFTEHKHYAYISSVSNISTPLTSTDWEVAVVNNNQNQNDESLVWTALSDTTAISGVADSAYYVNAYKLSFNSVGKYYLRAKYNGNYVYSVPINVSNMKENTEFEDVEFGDKTYNVHIFQWTRNNAAFYVVDYAPEEIEDLFSNVTYIKYQNTETSDRGLTVSYVDADLSSYSIIRYKYKQEESFHRSNGQLYGRMIYNDIYKPIKYESYENEKLKHETFTYYDDQGRTHVVKYVAYTYGEDNSATTKLSGYYYTYDENGEKTFHGTLPADFGGAEGQTVITKPDESAEPIE